MRRSPRWISFFVSLSGVYKTPEEEKKQNETRSTFEIKTHLANPRTILEQTAKNEYNKFNIYIYLN